MDRFKEEGDTVNGYRLLSAPGNKNSGTAKWCAADKGGEKFFIKQLLQPKGPSDNCSEAENKRREKACLAFKDTIDQRLAAIEMIKSSHVLKPTEFFFAINSFFFVSPFLEENAIDRSVLGRPLEEKFRLLWNLADGIYAMHQEGLIHGDIKEKNIIVTHGESGPIKLQAYIIDLDSAFFHSEIPQEWANDERYKAPEVAQFDEASGKNSSKITTASDVYSLGTLFYYLLQEEHIQTTEKYPYQELLNGHPLKNLAWHSHIPKEIRGMIEAMLALVHTDRPAMQQVVTVFAHACGEQPPIIPIISQQEFKALAKKIKNIASRNIFKKSFAKRADGDFELNSVEPHIQLPDILATWEIDHENLKAIKLKGMPQPPN